MKFLANLTCFCLAAMLPGGAAAMRGELSFPLEGWALVSHWHLGSGARSIREGYMLRTFSDGTWAQLAAGRQLPGSRDGTWLRNSFKYSSARWADAFLEAHDLPPGARIFINGRELGELEAEALPSLKGYLRTGTNSLALALPPNRANSWRVPEIRIKRIRLGSGRADPDVKLRLWRHRQDQVERFLRDNWIASSDTSAWRTETARPPVSGELWMPAAPVCLKAALDFPRYWAARELSAYFHEIPGDPDVYVNGRKCIDRLSCPARLELGALLKFDGRDSLCLVFPGLPRVPRREDGEWGVVAIHWGPQPRLPLFAAGATLLYEPVGDDREPGGRRALDYASQVLAVSASPYELNWAVREPGERERCGQAGEIDGLPSVSSALLSAWPGAPYSRDILDPLAGRIEERRDALLSSGLERIWIMSVPAVGGRSESISNGRLLVFRNRVSGMAGSDKVRVIPVFDVFRSALRCQQRWPAVPVFADAECRLSPHGSFLVGLAILDAFSLP